MTIVRVAETPAMPIRLRHAVRHRLLKTLAGLRSNLVVRLWNVGKGPAIAGDVQLAVHDLELLESTDAQHAVSAGQANDATINVTRHRDRGGHPRQLTAAPGRCWATARARRLRPDRRVGELVAPGPSLQ